MTLRSMRRECLTVLLVGTVFSCSLFAQGLLRDKTPDSAFTTDQSIEAVHLNLKRALEKCHRFRSVVAGTVYPTLKRAELEFFQASSETTLLAYAVVETEGAGSKVRVWAPKPTFGIGYSFIAKHAEQMVLQGAAYQCTSDW